MPTIFRYKGYKFFFYSNENDPIEPCHVHVRKETSLAKFWVVPSVKLVDSYGFNSSELNDLSKVIEDNSKLIEDKWNEYFNLK